jgi:hypothetical protein
MSNAKRTTNGPVAPTQRPDFDPLLATLGDAVQWLIDENDRLDELTLTGEHAQAAGRAQLQVQRRISDIVGAISALPATTPAGAAAQIRALSYLDGLPSEEDEERRLCLVYSIAHVLDGEAGVDHRAMGGEFFLPTYTDPYRLHGFEGGAS